ncbi:MAG TPA: NAD(P)-dependent oxidoreductase [Trichocoleus sp.]
MKTLLITGASGYLGWHLSQIAQSTWQVHGTYCSQPLAIPGATLHPVDLTQPADLSTFLDELRPDAVIHAAAQSKLNRCEEAPEASYEINVIATELLANHCAKAGIPAVFTSTDQVFDGTAAPYDEQATPNPVNRYGRQKLEAERRFLAAHPGGVVCRLPLMFGGPTPNAHCFLQDFVAQMRQGQPIQLFIDEYRTPAHIEDAARGLLLAVEKGQGVLHLGGQERLNRYQFGLLMAEIFDLPKALMQCCAQRDVPMAALRPADVSLVSERAFAMGYTPRSIAVALAAVASSAS